MQVSSPKKILYIVPHRYSRTGGQRFRCEQYLPFLEQAGFEWVHSPLLTTEREDADFYKSGNYLSKLLLFCKGVWRRSKDVIRAKDFDIIFIYREAMMTGTTLFERLLKRSGAKMVYDFDDAIWNYDVSAGNKNLGWLKRPEKVFEIIAMADMVLAGSNYLAEHARKYNNNVHVMPSTLDLNQYVVRTKKYNRDEPITIGWSGSVTTLKHFEGILPVYRKLKQKYGCRITFKLYGLPGYVQEELEIRSEDFSLASEVPYISTFDIGVMPLPDDEWTRGKCGMKGLQYMALGVPAVMQAIGANLDIISDGENGFLVTTEEEWVDKISQLIDSEDLRKSLAEAGRKTIEDRYSLQALHHQYVSWFQELMVKQS